MSKREPQRHKPGDRRSIGDHLWPARHGRFWNWDAQRLRHETEDELAQRFMPAEAETDVARSVELTLDQAKAIAQTAVDRAAAADRRATTIAGTVSVAATFTLSGIGLIVGTAKLPSWAVAISAGLIAVITTLFALSATYALRALAGKDCRRWKWEDPYALARKRIELSPTERITRRSAALLDAFAYNWEISDLKNRAVDNALRCLTIALGGVAALSIVITIAVLVQQS